MDVGTASSAAGFIAGSLLNFDTRRSGQKPCLSQRRGRKRSGGNSRRRHPERLFWR
jgi:hypothetical protein